MWRTRGRFGWGLTGVGAIAAVLLLLPLSSAGGVHASVAPVAAEKRGALGEFGRPVALPRTAETTVSGGLLGVATIASSGASAPRSSSLASAAPIRAAPLHPTSPQLLSKFAGVTSTTAGGYVPPDTQVAQGGTYVFELVNEYGRITSTTGKTVYSAFTVQSFLGTNSSHNVGDVQVLHDAITGRWLVSAEDFTSNYVYFDVSNTTSPLGAYWAYTLRVSFGSSVGQFMDQPVWGMSQGLFGVGTNQFNTTTLAYLGAILTVFGVAKLDNGHWAPQLFGYTGYFSLHPDRAVTANGSGADVLYVATTGSASSSTTLTVLEATGTVPAVAVTSVAYTIANTGVVPNGVQAGTTALVATGDDRVQSLSWSSVGALWVAFGTGCTPSGDATTRSCIRVDAIDTFNNALLQDSDVAVAGEYLYYGALTALNGGAGYLMVLSFSSSLAYPSIALTGENVSDPYNSFRGPVPAVSGTSYDTSGRFGDYSGLQLATSGGKATAWGAAEYSTASGWATEVVHFAFY